MNNYDGFSMSAAESNNEALEAPLLKLYAVDTNTDEMIAEITPGVTLDISLFEGRNVSFFAIQNPDNPESSSVSSVRLTLNDDVSRIESSSPYSLFGDRRGNFRNGKEFSEGEFTLTLEAFSGRAGNGELLEAISTDFSIGTPEPQVAFAQGVVETDEPLFKIFAVDTQTDETLIELVPGEAIEPSLFEGRLISFYAVQNEDNPNVGLIRSVRLLLNGEDARVENSAPYSMFGDRRGDFRAGETFDEGTFTLTLEAFTRRGGEGDLVGIVENEYVIGTDDAVEEPVAPNTAPVAGDDDASTDEDMSVVIDVLSNDSDADGDALSITSLTQPSLGSVTYNGDGTLTYVPDADANGSDSFTYTVSDGEDSVTATVSVTIDPVNDLPVITATQFAVAEDASVGDLVGQVTATDIDGGPLEYVITGGNDDGIFAIDTATGTITIADTANLDFETETDYALEISVSDGSGFVVGTTDITITDVFELTDSPDGEALLTVFAIDTTTDETLLEINPGDTIDGSLFEGRTISFYAIKNDDNPNSDLIGSVRIALNGGDWRTENRAPYSLEGDRRGDFRGGQTIEDGSFTLVIEAYTEFGAAGNLIETIITDFTVETADVPDVPVETNEPPVAVDDDGETNEDTSVTIDVLANDSDADGDAVSLVDFTQPSLGTVSENSDGTLTFTPDADANGSDSFTYTITDGEENSTATVSLTIAAVNDLPVVIASQFSVFEDAQVGETAGQISASDIDGDTLTYAITGGNDDGIFGIGPVSGTIVVDDTTNLDYERMSDYTLEVSVSDGQGVVVSTSEITVTDIDTAPVASEDAVTTAEDTSVTIDVLANDSDEDGDALTLESFTQPSAGSIALNSDGTLTYTPDADANGDDSFTYTVTDGLFSTTGTVSLTVTPQNDSPVAGAVSFSISEGAAVGDVVGTVVASDVDGDSLEFAITDGNTDGVFAIDSDSGQITVADTTNLDYETTVDYPLQVSVSDGVDTIFTSADVTITDVDETPADDPVEDPVDPPVDDPVDDPVEPPAPALLRVYAVDTTSDETIMEITPGQSIDASVFEGLTVSFYAVKNPEHPKSDQINSVRLSLNGSEWRTENAAPYALEGDRSGDFLGGDAIEGGSFTLVIEAYSERALGGSLVGTVTTAFTVSTTFDLPADFPVGSGDAPVVEDDDVSTNEDTSVTFNVLSNDSDSEGDSLFITGITQPGLGTVVNNGDGSLTFTPDADANGSDSFTYTVTDGNTVSSGTVNITVDAVNDLPVVTATMFNVMDNVGVGHVVGQVNASDADGDDLTYAITGGNDDGVFAINADTGAITIADTANLDGATTGSYSLEVTVNDGQGDAVGSTMVMVMEHTSGGHGDMGDGGHGDMGDGGHGGHDGGHGGHGDMHDAHAHHPFAQLVSYSDVTHTAVNSGSWFDPNTWAGGEVPPTGANVLISDGLKVTYDGESDARINTIRVDGELHFSSEVDTTLVVDTIVATGASTFSIGTEENPVGGDVQTNIVFAPVNPNDRELDKSEDPHQLGRGLVTGHEASVRIFGEEKTAFTTLDGNAYAGDTTLSFDDIPDDWEVGDTIVLTGTYTNERGNNDDNTMFHDEVLIITGIDGNTITFEHNDVGGNSLRFDHTTPEIEDHEFDIYVANLTRNIEFSSENGVDTAIDERGHTMFHSHDVILQGVSFVGMGRTDKAFLMDNPRFRDNGSWINGSGDNPSGRYPIHLHRPLDNANDDGTTHAIIDNNSVWDSPGWGYTIHGARAIVEDNVAFDITGSHFVTEDGDEQAYFYDNIAIKGTGDIVDGRADLLQLLDNERGRLEDLGVEGIGFWFQTSYSVREFTGNIATSVREAGVTVYGHHDRIREIATHPSIDVDLLKPEHQELFTDVEEIESWLVPLSDFGDFTVYNSMRDGVVLLGISRDQGRGNFGLNNFDTQSYVEDIEAWAIDSVGIRGSYVGNLYLKDVIVVGSPNAIDGFNGRVPGHDSDGSRGSGVLIGKNTRNVTLDNIRAEYFETGIHLPQIGGQGLSDQNPVYLDSHIIGGLFQNNLQNIGSTTGRIGNRARTPNVVEDFDTPYEILPIPTYVDWIELPEVGFTPNRAENIDPTANFVSWDVSGMTVEFDATRSDDPDREAVFTTDNYRNGQQIEYDVFNQDWHPNSNSPTAIGDNVIAAYLWDYNSDGIIDATGRYATHTFDVAGEHEVTLTVMDVDGGVASFTRTVTVENTVQENIVVNGDFSQGWQIREGTRTFESAGRGWNIGSESFNWNAGGEFLSDDNGNNTWQNFNQYIHDEGQTRGIQTFSFDAFRNNNNGDLQFQVFGVNGFPTGAVWDRFNAEPDNFLGEGNTVDLLASSRDIGGDLASFDWTTFEFQIDLNDGYDFIFIRFLNDGARNARYGFDNVFLGGGQANEIDVTSDVSATNDQDIFNVDTGDHVITDYLPGEDRLDLRDTTGITIDKVGDDVVVAFTGSDGLEGTVTLTDTDLLDVYDSMAVGDQLVENIRFGSTDKEVFTVSPLDGPADVIMRFEGGEGDDSLDLSGVITGFDAATDDISDFVMINRLARHEYEVFVNADGEGDDFELAATLVVDIVRPFTAQYMFDNGTFII